MTLPTTPRVQPLRPAELTDEQRRFIAPFTDGEGQYPNVFGTLLRHLPLLSAWRPFGLYTMRGSSLDPVLREVAILRTAHLSGCEYEWVHHCKIGERLGMSAALLDAIRADAPLPDAGHELCRRCADDLFADRCLSEPVWAAAQEAFGLDTTLDLIFTVGAYSTMAMALNSCGVALEGS